MLIPQSENENDDDFDSPKLLLRRRRHERGHVNVKRSPLAWLMVGSYGPGVTGCNATKKAIRTEIMARRYADGLSLWTPMDDCLELKEPEEESRTVFRPVKYASSTSDIRRRESNAAYYRRYPERHPWRKARAKLLMIALTLV